MRNDGVIASAHGSVALGAGDQVTVNLNGNKLIGLTVDQGSLNALAENKGLISVGGGTVILSAKAMDQLIRSVVNNDGIIEATGITTAGGNIRLEADVVVQTGTLAASGTQGGRIGIDARAIIDAGTAYARGIVGDGGDIGYRAAEGIVQTAAARLDASRATAGGRILLTSGNALFTSGTLVAGGLQGGNIELTAALLVCRFRWG